MRCQDQLGMRSRLVPDLLLCVVKRGRGRAATITYLDFQQTYLDFLLM